MKVKVGGQEYDVPEKVGKAFMDMEKQMKSMKDQMEEKATKMKDLEESMGEMKKKTADLGSHGARKDEKIKALEDEIKKYQDIKTRSDEDQDFLNKMAVRNDALELAKRLVPTADFERLKTVKLDEIKKTVIKSHSPSVDNSRLENSDYVDARFDVISESFKNSDKSKEETGKQILKNKQTKEDSVLTPAQIRLASMKNEMDRVRKRMDEGEE